MTHTTSSDRTTAVSTTTHYLPMYSCPIAKKVILLGAGGVATVAQWDGKDKFWQGWHPLPRRMVDETPPGWGWTINGAKAEKTRSKKLMDKTPKLTNQLIFECIQDLHNREKPATREHLASRFGVALMVIDHHIKQLLSSDRIVKIKSGVYAPAFVSHESRPVSTTFLNSGHIKLEIGDDVLQLTPSEGKKVAIAMAGLVTV